jgi:hypothetical protein
VIAGLTTAVQDDRIKAAWAIKRRIGPTCLHSECPFSNNLLAESKTLLASRDPAPPPPTSRSKKALQGLLSQMIALKHWFGAGIISWIMKDSTFRKAP